VRGGYKETNLERKCSYDVNCACDTICVLRDRESVFEVEDWRGKSRYVLLIITKAIWNTNNGPPSVPLRLDSYYTRTTYPSSLD